jgi:hypothetical protein
LGVPNPESTCPLFGRAKKALRVHFIFVGRKAGYWASMVVQALRGGWIPAFAGMTTGESESGRNGGNDTGKESTYKREVHPSLDYLGI